MGCLEVGETSKIRLGFLLAPFLKGLQGRTPAFMPIHNFKQILNHGKLENMMPSISFPSDLVIRNYG